MNKPTPKTHASGHRYALKRLSSYMDGQLSDQEQTRVQAHLNACPDCRNELRTLRWTHDLTQQMPVLPVPRSFIVREADLEPAPAARPMPRFSRALAGLQTTAAIVAVLLVLVIAGDALIGNGFPLGSAAPGGAAPEIARLQEVETPTMPAQTLAKQLPDDRAVVQEQAQDPEPQPEMLSAAVTEPPTEPTAAEAPMAVPTANTADPTPEPSPTWTAGPTRTPTPLGSPAETALTKRSSTPQPTVTATTAPTHTPTTEVPTATPTPEPLPTAQPTWTAAPTLVLEPEQVVMRPELSTEEQTEYGENKLEAQGDQSTIQTEVRNRQGWRIVQAALGLVLAGLLFAIIWLRLQARAG